MKNSNGKIDVGSLILSIYATLVWFTYIFVNVESGWVLRVFVSVCIFVLSYYFMHVLGDKLRLVDLSFEGELSAKKKLLTFGISAAVVFAFMMIWFAAYFPGDYDSDSWNSFSQALNGKYNDWHPVWYTLVFHKIPVTLFGTPQSVIALQILYYSLILGYMALTIRELAGLKATVFSLIYLLVNPYNCYIMLHAWKDVAFCITALLCTVFAIRLILIEERTRKLWNVILFGVALASATLYRHNAILYTAPLILVLLFHIKKKTWIQIVVVTVAFLIIVKGPVYKALDVEKPDRRTEETTGIPLTVIGNVAKETPEKMDEELSEFVYSVATPEQWSNYDLTYGYCSLKWTGINAAPVEEKGFFGMVKLMFKCFALSPEPSWKAFFATTDLVYGFESGMKGYFYASFSENPYGETPVYEKNERLQQTIGGYAAFFNGSIFRYLRTFGVALFAILVVYLSRMNFTSWQSWKKAFIIVPLFAHDFGTMLLLSGPDSRFFFITYLVTPILIIYALLKEDNI